MTKVLGVSAVPAILYAVGSVFREMVADGMISHEVAEHITRRCDEVTDALLSGKALDERSGRLEIVDYPADAQIVRVNNLVDMEVIDDDPEEENVLTVGG